MGGEQQRARAVWVGLDSRGFGAAVHGHRIQVLRELGGGFGGGGASHEQRSAAREGERTAPGTRIMILNQQVSLGARECR